MTNLALDASAMLTPFTGNDDLFGGQLMNSQINLNADDEDFDELLRHIGYTDLNNLEQSDLFNLGLNPNDPDNILMDGSNEMLDSNNIEHHLNQSDMQMMDHHVSPTDMLSTSLNPVNVDPIKATLVGNSQSPLIHSPQPPQSQVCMLNSLQQKDLQTDVS